MNITILTNKNQYPYHNIIAGLIFDLLNKSDNTVSVLDIHSEKYDYLCLQKLNKFSPQVLITLDLAGFHFRTQTGENALNMLTAKNLNILWGNKKEYAPLLSKKISLSMLFYDASGKDHSLSQYYPNLEYYKFSEQFLLETDAKTYSNTEKNFFHIWEDFMKEALHFET